MKKQLVIINNESTFNNGDFFFCDNIAMKTISEGLNKNFEVAMILRKSSFIRSYKINLKKIKTCSNILSFILSIFKTFKYKETSYLIISITPYTFFAYIFLFLFNKKKFVYLRSNGYEEYKAIFGIFGPGEDSKRLFPSIISSIKEKKSFPIDIPEVFSDYVYIKTLISY